MPKTLLLLFALLALCFPARAGNPVIWDSNSRAEMLRGEARGVSISDTGALSLAPRLTQLFNTEQAYVWSCALDDAGTAYLGTGHDGRIYRIGADGRGALLTDTAELEVTALVVGRDGVLYAGTSPDGKVYRIGADGRAEVHFDPPDKYIWSLAVMNDGALAVGTGDNGKIYRVRAAGAKPESSLLIDVDETNIISLESDGRGQLIAGTDPGGLVLRVSPDGKAFALYDSPLREIHSIAPAPDGSIYVLALSEAAAGGRASGAAASPLPAPGGGAGSVTVTVTPLDDGGAGQAAGGGAPSPSRSRNDLSNVRSAIFRIAPDGGTDVLWSSTTVTAFSLTPAGQGVLIGTSDKGRIYSVGADGREKLLLQSSEDQISVLKSRGSQVYAASSNQGKLFRFGGEAVAEGSYESAVRDTRFVASWGRIWWRGGGRAELQTRTGNTERPDATWSEWSAPYRTPAGSNVTSPRARFLQWRAVLRSAPNSPEASVEDINIAYLPRNVAPEVLSITTLPPGVGLQPAVQVQVDPNVEASGLNPALFGAVAQVPPRRLYQRGALSLQWQVEDRNGDTLEYQLFYRALNETSFLLLKDKLRDSFYTVDGAALADGRYVFKVVATDAPDNPNGMALTGERTSEAVEIDNTPPVVRSVNPPEGAAPRVRVRFEVTDATGMVKRADFSVDGGDWRSVFPDDGIADGPRETYTVEVPLTNPGEHTVSLRAFDGSGNVGSLRVAVRR